jgi:RNA polymerase sigma factor (sigma-70 family)
MTETPSQLAHTQHESFDLATLRGDAGDSASQEEVWLRVYRHFHPRLDSFFRTRCSTDYSLDELLTDLWSRACLHIRSLRSSDALWSWLTTIGNNLLADARRRLGRSREVVFSDLGDADKQVERLLAGWISPSVDEIDTSVLEGLTAEERELLALYAVDGLSHGEIATRLGLASAAASRQRLRRIRVRLTGVASD